MKNKAHIHGDSKRNANKKEKIKVSSFQIMLHRADKKAWTAFGNTKTENQQEIVQEVLKCIMSYKIFCVSLRFHINACRLL